MNTVTDDVPITYRDRSPLFKDAEQLVRVGRDVHGRDALLHPSAAEAWSKMTTEAARSVVTPLIVSAFRSIDRQREIVRRKREKGLSWDAILSVSAYPGFSQHHTGCAVYIGSPGCCGLVEEFENTKEFRWLTMHAVEFG